MKKEQQQKKRERQPKISKEPTGGRGGFFGKMMEERHAAFRVVEIKGDGRGEEREASVREKELILRLKDLCREKARVGDFKVCFEETGDGWRAVVLHNELEETAFVLNMRKEGGNETLTLVLPPAGKACVELVMEAEGGDALKKK